GPPDNLELIHGVGPILRSMLNDRGIYYFWQVAEWSPEDVTQIDAQLMEFRGRIRRDDWVRHAGQLAALPTSAKRPISQYGRRD
ncbi:MAG TPA: hypothetical protein VG942_13650, partial [Hyphomonadaceae bacterium]|nr:hypothetical protein [Hyphomonadaceae bacterium]